MLSDPKEWPPLDVGVKVETDLAIDVFKFFSERINDYLKFRQQENAGYQYWEKPIGFIWNWAESESDGATYFDSHNSVKERFANFDVEMRWTEQMTIDLHEALNVNRDGTEIEVEPEPISMFEPS